MGVLQPLRINYQATATGAKFHASDAFVRGIRGPIGSGKSVTCCMEIFRRAAQQRPSPKDGIRRSRWAIVRNTYGELKTTTIKTWQDWFPSAICPIVYDAPIRAVLRVKDIELEILFIALDLPAHVKKLLSLELTGAWLNEARELSKAVVDGLTGRVGRYPSKRDGGASWSGVIMDTNPPGDDHWWYRTAEEERPVGWDFFAQPPALIKHAPGVYTPNPAAENVENHELGFDYWLRQLGGKKDEWIKVYILGQYGTVLDGRLVFSEYRDDYHCAGDILEPMRGLPLLLGWDYGRTPACVIGQLTPKGQLRVLDELVVDSAGDSMGIRAFTRERVKPHLSTKYPGMTIAASWGDPSGVARDGNDLSCFDIQAQEGIPTVGANSNDPQARQDAVSRYLMANVDGEPAYLLSPNCVFLRKGFLGGYRFTRIQVAGEERYRDMPEKNRFSHPHDAHQHMCQAAHGAVTVAASAHVREVKKRSAGGWT